MTETKKYIDAFFIQQKIDIPEKQKSIFEKFIADEKITEAVKNIKENQKIIMDKYKILNRVYEISNLQISFPNATQGILYSAKLDFMKLGIDDIVFIEFEGLSEFGLNYNLETDCIEGTPVKNGDVKATLKYRLNIEAENSTLNEKQIAFYINTDPKLLWTDKPSDKTDPFWKEDNVSIFDKIGTEKNIVISSKRGRSHANVGSFRDDDFSYKHNEETGWSAVAVADGAGSYKYSRQGSKIACNEVVDYLLNGFTKENSAEIENLLIKLEELKNKSLAKGEATEIKEDVVQRNELTISDEVEDTTTLTEEKIIEKIVEETVETVTKQIQGFLYKNLGTAVFNIHKKIEAYATENSHTVKDYGSTLIFTLFKKMDIGYCMLSFGVGDCPIAVVSKDQSESFLLNWLDVGEFGGGTRFITMPEIFTNANFITRFNFKVIDNFSYLILMTDGIYDPKFVVEANLEKVEKWNEFIADLKGNNEEKNEVIFDNTNTEIANQLSQWMDFWSAGNHDDRTLAIVY